MNMSCFEKPFCPSLKKIPIYFLFYFGFKKALNVNKIKMAMAPFIVCLKSN